MRSTIVQTQVNFYHRKDPREQKGQMEGMRVIQDLEIVAAQLADRAKVNRLRLQVHFPEEGLDALLLK